MSVIAEYLEAAGVDMELFQSATSESGLDESYY